ncbi:MAG: hypothetical protein K6E88_07580 [Lachnospiraceae bacterium]|nr:hypothetical protein [Lachnospiraceae bacterium]
MRSEKLFATILSVTLLSLALAGCGRDKKPELKIDDNTKQESLADDNKGTEEHSEPADDGNEAPARDDEKDKERDLKKYNASARRAYEAFLADEVLAVSEIDEQGFLREGNRYSFSDIIETYIKNESQYLDPSDQQIKLKDATYSYIDCGVDGSVELVTDLVFSLYDEENVVCFFKYDDGEVHLMGKDSWGYRSFMTVNEYGYVDNGGSGGANRYYNECYYFDADGKRVFLYSEETLMGMDSPRVSKYNMKNGFDRDDYPDDSFDTEGYTITTVSFKEYKYEEGMTDEDLYEKYYKDYMYCFEYEQEGSVNPDSYMIDLYKREGVKWYSRDELDRIVDEHQDELGADSKIRQGNEVEWESIVDLGIMKYPVEKEDNESGEQVSTVKKYVILDDHEKPYINPDNPYIDHEYRPVTLKQISCRENDITDTAEWFARAGTSESGTFFNDDNYHYKLTGDAGYGTMTHIEIYTKDMSEQLYDFDFSDFLYEKGYEGEDFVDRGIRNCFITDDLLYLNIAHRTYAQDCPVNAFMICVDINSGEVMWISEPLVSNSNNFVRHGDNMITGYGFTAEDDYICILNRFTGKLSDRIKVKKSPDHFAFVNHDLWVRTYSYDYEFSITDR